MPDSAARSGWRDLPNRVLAPHRPFLALTLLGLFLYLPAVWNRDVWSPDEPRYTEVSREMVLGGEYFLPHLNGEVYAEKPPMFFWLGILAGSLPGVPFDSGTRLVSVLAAIGSMLLTFSLGRRFLGERAGWIAALILATSSMFVSHASSGVIDATLAFLVIAAIKVGLDAGSSRSPVLWGLFYLVTAVAVITKGPVGFVLPAGALLILSVWKEGWSGLRASHPLWGVGLILLVAAAWLVPAVWRGGADYAETILFKQNITRAVDAWHHRKSTFYFLRAFPVSFLPWVFFLPAGIVAAFRKARKQGPGGPGAALIWFGFVFVFFSALSGKKTRYLLPLFPAAAMLAALEVDAVARGAARRVRAWLPAGLTALALAAAGTALVLAGAGALQARTAGIQGLSADQAAALLRLQRMPGSLAILVPGMIIAGLAVAGFASTARRPARCVRLLVVSAVGLVGCAQWIVVPALNPLKSARPLAELAAAEVAPGSDIVLFGESHAGAFDLYARRTRIPVLHDAEALDRLVRADPGIVILSSRRDLRRLRERIASLEELSCRRIGGGVFCASRLAGQKEGKSGGRTEAAIASQRASSLSDRPAAGSTALR